jgi:hypothetical protein
MHRIATPLHTRYGLYWTLWERFGYFDVDRMPNDLVEEFMTRIEADHKWQHEQQKRDTAVAKSKGKGGKRG